MNLSKFFRWNPTRETWLAFAVGLLVILLSWGMVQSAEIPWLSIVLRDELMIVLVGTLFPLWYIKSKTYDWAEFGLSTHRWPLFLLINLMLAGSLAFVFWQEVPLPADFSVTTDKVYSALFILLAGIFEVVFFYSFLRTLFERAFGLVPAIILASLFYSYHHIGFQPEYLKLFVAGLSFAIPFRLANSALVIYPFYWGVGGIYDVLVQSQVVSTIQFPFERSLIIVSLLVLAIRVYSAFMASQPNDNRPVVS